MVFSGSHGIGVIQDVIPEHSNYNFAAIAAVGSFFGVFILLGRPLCLLITSLNASWYMVRNIRCQAC